MSPLLLAIILILPLPAVDLPAESADSSVTAAKPHYWAAAGLTLSIDAAVSAFDRVIFSQPEYKSDLSSIRQNIKGPWVWDNDSFFLNQIGHPIQGAMYFTAAKACGLGFWGSALATVPGSLAWELLCENDPPSINDLLTTTAGGMATGEVLWRLGRIFSGKDAPRRMNAGIGVTALKNGDGCDIINSIGVQAWLDVHNGDPFDCTGGKPYDWFTLALKAGIGTGYAGGVEQVSIAGRLWGKSVTSPAGNDIMFGIFQHFNYLDLPGMKISESNSFGPGVIVRSNDDGPLHNTELQALVGAVIMGGIQSDHYLVLKRDYNMCSGASFHGGITHDWGKSVYTSLKWDHYQLFTLREYDHGYLDSGGDPKYLDSAGCRLSAGADILSMTVDIRCLQHLDIRIAPAYYCRCNHYEYHDDVSEHCAELTFGLGWQF